MKQRIGPLGVISKRTVILFSSSGIIIASLIFMSIGMVMTPEETRSTESTVSTSMVIALTIPPTKWWIKIPAMPSMPTETINNASEDCQTSLSSPLQSGIYAYISLTPPLPNRVRAGAGKANAYLGQIQPGAGVKIIDGPLCADGFSWWLVETVESDLRGWTVGGSKSEQWVLPCPDPTGVCKMAPVTSQATLTTVPSSTQNNNKDTCNSDKFSIGMLAQVEQDNLLVIRSEPYIGSVVWHAGPASAVTIVGGPACAGGVLWWKVNVASLNLSGWAAEANLRACSKEDGCT